MEGGKSQAQVAVRGRYYDAQATHEAAIAPSVSTALLTPTPPT